MFTAVGNGVINEAGCWDYLLGMTLGAIHVSQVPGSGWPGPLRYALSRAGASAMRLVLLQSAIQNPKIENPKSCVGPSAILTRSRTRPSDWGSNARFGPVEVRRNNRRPATFTYTPCVLQIWWLSPFHLSPPFTCTPCVLQIWWLSPHLSPHPERASGTRSTTACSA